MSMRNLDLLLGVASYQLPAQSVELAVELDTQRVVIQSTQECAQGVIVLWARDMRCR